VKIMRIVLGTKKTLDASRLRKQRGSRWDAWLSYSLALQATK